MGEHHEQLGKYYHVQAPIEHYDNLIDQLQRHPHVEHAYISPALVLPGGDITANEHFIGPRQAGRKTPDMTSDQNRVYGASSNGGMDVLYAHSQPGGRGEHVMICHVEHGWMKTHEDLKNNILYVGDDGNYILSRRHWQSTDTFQALLALMPLELLASSVLTAMLSALLVLLTMPCTSLALSTSPKTKLVSINNVLLDRCSGVLTICVVAMSFSH